MKILNILIITCYLILASINTSIQYEGTEGTVDNILAEWWKVGDRWHYTTISAIKETECDHSKEKLKQIKDFFKQKYGSNQLVTKVVDILISGKEQYLKEEVCNLVNDTSKGDLLLIQSMEINDSFKKTQPLRKSFTCALLNAGRPQPNNPINLPNLLCLMKQWAQQTIEKTSQFFNARHRIKRWFELNINPIITFFEASGHISALPCDLSKIDHSQANKSKSVELLLLDTLNLLTSGQGSTNVPILTKKRGERI